MTATLERPGAHELACNGVLFVRTPAGIGVEVQSPPDCGPRDITIEVWNEGKLLKEEQFLETKTFHWRDYIKGVDTMRSVVRVLECGMVLAELGLPDEPYPLPFMVTQVQRHVTEHYVSVPPALTITDERGDVW